jgi:hypothetical protein
MNLILTKENLIPTKAEIDQQAKDILAMVSEDGGYDVFAIYGRLTALEQLVEQTKKELKQMVIDKAEIAYGNKEFEVQGVKFKVKNLPADTKSFFQEQEKWQKANKKVNDAKAKLKGIEEDLKAQIKLNGWSFPSGGSTIQVTLAT